jgi:hypothetical protein
LCYGNYLSKILFLLKADLIKKGKVAFWSLLKPVAAILASEKYCPK